jgi:hypothetical protein
MALTRESIGRILEGMAVLTRTLEARLATVNDLDAAKRLIAELGAAQWEGSPDAADAERLPFILARIRSGRVSTASLPPNWTVFGKLWREVLEMPATAQELTAVRARAREIAPVVLALWQVQVDAELRLMPPPADFPPAEETRRKATTIRPEDPEAREWLRSNPGDAPLAANAFDADAARGFVDALYAAGARRVVIASENIVDEDPPYCDALRVRLPEDPTARAAVFALTNAEALSEGLDPDEDTGQDAIFLWWD